MIIKSKNSLGVIILAAGRGKRMDSKNINKVALSFSDKPLILHSIHLLEKMDFSQIIVVIGHAKESVKNVLKDSNVVLAEQENQLGTADAAKSALSKLDKNISDVLVIQGDDSHFYNEEIISNLITKHFESNASLTFLTIEIENPVGLGRIVRDKKGKVLGIVEEKDAADVYKKINEVNPACYIFKKDFLKKYLPNVKKSEVTGEYYLTSLIDIAIKNNEKIETLRAGKIPWRGINTREELIEAEKIHRESSAVE